MDYVRREVYERSLVEEAIDPDGIEGYGHVEEDRVCHLFAEVPGYFSRKGTVARGCCAWV